MTLHWTVDQILALAPDSQSAKAGHQLATLRKWDNLGQNEGTIWGECQGSGQKPYQTRIDLGEPAFKCSCPSRKFPCKHALALFLLAAQQSESFKPEPPPEWVKSWLESRVQRQQQKNETASKKSSRTADPARGQVRRAAKRQEKVEAGLADLERWLLDLVRAGLASAQGKSRDFWEMPAARLVDAQAAGLAGRLRRMASLPYTGEGWQEKLVEGLGLLHLLLEGYRRLETLPDPVQADIRTLIGWSQSQEALLAEPGISDRWWVVGQQLDQEQRLLVQRTWLWSQRDRRGALLLNFTRSTQIPDRSLVPGTGFEAELVFYPGNYPLRAVIKERGPAAALEALPGYTGCAEALAAYAGTLARQPWLEEFPLVLQKVIPSRRNNTWFLADAQGEYLPINPHFAQGWPLLALSGGHPITLFGLWDGAWLLPLGALAGERFVDLNSNTIQPL